MESTLESDVRWDVQVNDGIGVALAGDVVLVLWNAPARAPRIKWIFDLTQARAGRLPGGIITLQIIRETATPPDAEGRAENARGLKRAGDRLRRLVTVPVGDALWTRLVRTVMRGMFIIQGKSDQHFVCARVSEGVTELLHGAGARTPPRADVEAGLKLLYAAMKLTPER